MISDVSDTSFWVAYYRAKETERPDAIFKDPLAKVLLGERAIDFAKVPKSFGKYSEWSILLRTVMIDRMISDLITEGVDLVLNLGAGLDARPYRMNLPADLKWIEVDFPHIISYKAEKLKKYPVNGQLSRFALDLADRSSRQKFLNEVADQGKNILVLTEGVIPYLNEIQVAELAEDLRLVPNIKYWITEYFDPKVYRHLQNPVRLKTMKNAPFLFYPPNWLGFFEHVGWRLKTIRYHVDLGKELGRPSPMPWWVRMLMPLLPKKMKSGLRMTGYVVLRPG